jgi:hypothetical protein
VADPESPFSCTASSTQPGKSVCTGVIFSGGGGFCTVGGTNDASSGSNGRGALLLLGFVALVLTLRPRRRAGRA